MSTKNGILIANIINKNNFTVSVMYVFGEAKYFLLQDEARAVKVMGDTRIGDGDYFIELREELTPLTQKYRKNPNLKDIGFDFHIEITGISNFKNVYIHIGNFTKDTAGCPLIGFTADITSESVGESTLAYKEFYKKIRPLLGGGKRIPCKVVTITSSDEIAS